MPCDSSHCRPRDHEIESARIISLLRAVGEPAPETHGSVYGHISTLDADTERLCSWCKTHDVTGQSLELQIWWRDHQKADAKKASDEAARVERERVKAEAIAKLTPDERLALGIREPV